MFNISDVTVHPVWGRQFRARCACVRACARVCVWPAASQLVSILYIASVTMHTTALWRGSFPLVTVALHYSTEQGNLRAHVYHAEASVTKPNSRKRTVLDACH
jgi:hypothetical protein